MKKTITILFIVLFFQHLQLIAQDYQLFMSNRTYTYEYIFSGQSHFNVFMADTVIVNGTDSIFSNYPRSNDDNLYGPPADTTEYYSDTTWSGYKVIVSPNGKNILLNRFSDSLIFMCNAGLGDSWSLYSFPDGSHFTATVSAISFDTICGSLPDSVKSISILHLDSIGTVIPDSLNNFRFRLSKSFGLITGLNVKHFPLRQWIYQLAGIDSIIGQQPITVASIFNYDVGDEFHYTSYNQISTSNNEYKFEKRTILSKVVQPNSITYTVLDSVYTMTIYVTMPVETLTGNIITETIATHPNSSFDLCDKRPYTAGEIGAYNFVTSWHRSVADRRAIYTVPCVSKPLPYIPSYTFIGSGGCIGSPYDFPGGSNWFVEGLGLFNHFSSFDSSTSMFPTHKFLAYYKKGNETYGSPIVFPIITNIEDKEISSNAIRVYPNPSSYQATIFPIAENSAIFFYDTMMHEIQVPYTRSRDQVTVETNKLPEGLYFVFIKNGSHSNWMRVLVGN